MLVQIAPILCRIMVSLYVCVCIKKNEYLFIFGFKGYSQDKSEKSGELLINELDLDMSSQLLMSHLSPFFI